MFVSPAQAPFGLWTHRGRPQSRPLGIHVAVMGRLTPAFSPCFRILRPRSLEGAGSPVP